MFFEISKLAWFVLDPLNFLFLLVLAACALLWAGKARPARLLVSLVSVAFIAVLATPLPKLLLVPLEQRFPHPERLPEKVGGIVLLGGAQQPVLTKHFGQPAMNGAAETMTTFLALARRYPHARLVFTGGSGDPLHQDVTEAATVRLFLEQQGFDSQRVRYETRSRNTYENALLAKSLAAPRPGETWLLVAGASHMPRAIGVFRKQGWPVVPVPANYTAVPTYDWKPTLSALTAFTSLGLALHEWIGLAAYYATGKTGDLFPAPEKAAR